MADLLTLTELRDFLGVDPTDTRDDAQFTALIPAASAAVSAFAQRDFGATSVTEVRTYQYDGSGYLDIDDATMLTTIEFVVPNASNITVPSDLWTALPYNGPIYNYVQINDVYSGVNPAMGFERNLDVLYREGRLSAATTAVAVTATWGWPDIPLTVKLATAWTIQDWKDKASSEGLTSESIDSFARSWGSKTGGPSVALAIPNRARDLLAQFQRENV